MTQRWFLSLDFASIRLPFAGNLNTYVMSYLRQSHPELTYADWSFLSTTKTLVTGVTMPFGGQFSRKFGIRLSMAVGAVIYWYVGH